MRLTQTHREAFVRAVMQDVPAVNYREQAQKIIQDFQVRHMPKEIQAIYKNPELRGYLRAHNFYVYRIDNGFYAAIYGDAKLDDATKAKLDDLEKLDSQQQRQHRDLEAKLKAVLASVTTRKALVEALPEFEKYAPAEDAPLSRNVPALANIVTDFMAAGWPKGKKPTPVAKAPTKRARKTTK